MLDWRRFETSIQAFDSSFQTLMHQFNVRFLKSTLVQLFRVFYLSGQVIASSQTISTSLQTIDTSGWTIETQMQRIDTPIQAAYTPVVTSGFVSSDVQ